ncbi:MAG: DegT/DnrJ/EryC1/StrS aminotransferase family protein [Anaerolineales bacterium]|nr:DegT/DnrJ/EryC1/StrS aminotransferase family protein [Anaerolineales bacterium]
MPRLFLRHLPPVAVPIQGVDLLMGLNALRDPHKHTLHFQQALSDRIGERAVHLVSSGRAALTLILLALRRLSEQKKVIVPAYSCPTVVQSIQAAGLEPLFCDVSATTLDLDREALSQLLDHRPLAILPTHLYGLSQDVRDILALGKKHGIFIIEDAAQAFGARLADEMVGTLGDAGFYSLGRGKCIPAGHGGVILAREHLATVIQDTLNTHLTSPVRSGANALILFLAYGVVTRPLGWWFVSRSALNPARTGMQVEELPPSHLDHLTGVLAALGNSILQRLHSLQTIARQNAHALQDRLASARGVAFFEQSPVAWPVYLRLPLLGETQARTEELFFGLRRAGIGVSRSYTRTLPELFPELAAPAANQFPGAQRLANCLLTLPTHAFVTQADYDRILRVFQHLNV